MTLWNTNRIQVGGLLFSGLLISCLGAVMDIAMSISSAIDEIYKQNSSLTKKELFKAGMRVGSFGIVLSVPLTVLICTVLFHKKALFSLKILSEEIFDLSCDDLHQSVSCFHTCPGNV